MLESIELYHVDSQGALNVFNKNMKIEWIQYK